MKLRHRLALYFALGSSAVLVLSRVVTLASFQRVQEYELDSGLNIRAQQEGNAVALVGRKALEAEYDGNEDAPDPLEQLVTYGALYRSNLTLAGDTRSFSRAPALAELGIANERDLRNRLGDCFDFKFRGSVLRGVIVEVKGTREKQYLLVAASRRDMDEDAKQLLAVGWWVLAASIAFTLAVGWWFGHRTTRGVQDLAASARRVAGGELDVRFEFVGPRDEEVVALAAAMREMVTRLKKLLDAERRFASHAAHELRSPLAVLRGELELALRRPRSESEYQTFLREALDDTKRLADLAENLLVVARSGKSGSTTRSEPIEIRSLVDEAIAASRARAPGAPTVEVDGDDGCVEGVRADLVRLIRNLLDNAIEHGGEHGEPSEDMGTPAVGTRQAPLRVHMTVTESEARIEIEDDGPGISEEDRDRIFEHFYRGADARAISGAGLGLGIAREIAVRHGGSLVLDSIAKPTRFVICLPLAGAKTPELRR